MICLFHLLFRPVSLLQYFVIMMAQKQNTIFDKLGGYRQIQKVVGDFYQTILNDEALNIYYLEDLDISSLLHLVTDFFSHLFGGHARQTCRGMTQTHKQMPIRKVEFQGVLKHMKLSLKKHKVSQELIKEIMDILWTFQDQVVTIK